MKKRIFISNTAIVLVSLLILFGTFGFIFGLFRNEYTDGVEQENRLSDYIYEVQTILLEEQKSLGTWEELSGKVSSYDFSLYVTDIDTRGGMSMMGGSGSSSGAENFSELMTGANGEPVSRVVTDSYEVLYGAWPEDYDEIVLVLDENNAISAGTLYQLGLITADEYMEITEQIKDGKEADERTWDYEEITEHIFYLVPACDRYTKNDNGTFSYIGDEAFLKQNSFLKMRLN